MSPALEAYLRSGNAINPEPSPQEMAPFGTVKPVDSGMGMVEDAAGRFVRGAVGGLAGRLETISELGGNDWARETLGGIRKSAERGEVTPILPPVNPVRTDTLVGGVAGGLGSAAPAVPLFFGGPVGMGAELAMQARGGYRSGVEAQEEKARADAEAGGLPLGEEPMSPAAQAAMGVGGAAVAGGVGKVLAPLLGPLTAGLRPSLQVPAAVAASFGTQVAGDAAMKSLEGRIRGKGWTPYHSIGELGESLGSSAAFTAHPAVEISRAVRRQQAVDSFIASRKPPVVPVPAAPTSPLAEQAAQHQGMVQKTAAARMTAAEAAIAATLSGEELARYEYSLMRRDLQGAERTAALSKAQSDFEAAQRAARAPMSVEEVEGQLADQMAQERAAEARARADREAGQRLALQIEGLREQTDLPADLPPLPIPEDRMVRPAVVAPEPPAEAPQIGVAPRIIRPTDSLVIENLRRTIPPDPAPEGLIPVPDVGAPRERVVLDGDTLEKDQARVAARIASRPTETQAEYDARIAKENLETVARNQAEAEAARLAGMESRKAQGIEGETPIEVIRDMASWQVRAILRRLVEANPELRSSLSEGARRALDKAAITREGPMAGLETADQQAQYRPRGGAISDGRADMIEAIAAMRELRDKKFAEARNVIPDLGPASQLRDREVKMQDPAERSKMRRELRDLGIEPQDSWGRAKMEEEIAAAKQRIEETRAANRAAFDSGEASKEQQARDRAAAEHLKFLEAQRDSGKSTPATVPDEPGDAPLSGQNKAFEISLYKRKFYVNPSEPGTALPFTIYEIQSDGRTTPIPHNAWMETFREVDRVAHLAALDAVRAWNGRKLSDKGSVKVAGDVAPPPPKSEAPRPQSKRDQEEAEYNDYVRRKADEAVKKSVARSKRLAKRGGRKLPETDPESMDAMADAILKDRGVTIEQFQKLPKAEQERLLTELGNELGDMVAAKLAEGGATIIPADAPAPTPAPAPKAGKKGKKIKDEAGLPTIREEPPVPEGKKLDEAGLPTIREEPTAPKGKKLDEAGLPTIREETPAEVSDPLSVIQGQIDALRAKKTLTARESKTLADLYAQRDAIAPKPAPAPIPAPEQEFPTPPVPIPEADMSRPDAKPETVAKPADDFLSTIPMPDRRDPEVRKAINRYEQNSRLSDGATREAEMRQGVLDAIKAVKDKEAAAPLKEAEEMAKRAVAKKEVKRLEKLVAKANDELGLASEALDTAKFNGRPDKEIQRLEAKAEEAYQKVRDTTRELAANRDILETRRTPFSRRSGAVDGKPITDATYDRIFNDFKKEIAPGLETEAFRMDNWREVLPPEKHAEFEREIAARDEANARGEFYGFPMAMLGEKGGKRMVFVNKDAIKTPQELMDVLAEEHIGHYGLMRLLGKDFKGLIQDFYKSLIGDKRRIDGLRMVAKEYQHDLTDPAGQFNATMEYVAKMATSRFAELPVKLAWRKIKEFVGGLFGDKKKFLNDNERVYRLLKLGEAEAMKPNDDSPLFSSKEIRDLERPKVTPEAPMMDESQGEAGFASDDAPVETVAKKSKGKKKSEEPDPADPSITEEAETYSARLAKGKKKPVVEDDDVPWLTARRPLTDVLDAATGRMSKEGREAYRDAARILDSYDTRSENVGAQFEQRIRIRTLADAGKNNKLGDEILGAQAILTDMGLKAGLTPAELAHIRNVALPDAETRVAAALTSTDKNTRANAEMIAKYMPKVRDLLTNDAPEAMRLGQIAKEALDELFQQRKAVKPNSTYLANYFPRFFEADSSTAGYLRGGGSGGSRSFNQIRSLESLFDGMESGRKLLTLDSAAAIGRHAAATDKMVGEYEFVDWGKNTRFPGTGTPYFADLVEKWKEVKDPATGLMTKVPGSKKMVPPAGYEVVQLPGLKGEVAVNTEAAPMLNVLLGDSSLRSSVTANLALDAAAFAKQGLLVFDTFHVGRVIYKLASLAAASSDGSMKTFLETLSIPKFNAKVSGLDIHPSDIAEAEAKGLVTPAQAVQARRMHAVYDDMIKSGVNIGGNLENQWDRIKHVYDYVPKVGPFIEKFNKWTFQKLTRSAMATGWMAAREYNTKRFPGLTQEQVDVKTAQQINEYFGNIGRQGIWKSKTFQDISQMILLAPRWSSSQLLSEIRGLKEGAWDSVKDAWQGKLRLGLMARTQAYGALSMFVIANIMNMAPWSKGKPVWDNPEDGHKLDAWIPGGEHGFWFSPISLSNEYLHHAMEYEHKRGSPLGAAMQIAGNKLGPVGRAIGTMATGRDWMGTKLSDSGRVIEAGKGLLPVPMALQHTLLSPGQSPPGSTTRSLVGMTGIKLSPAESPSQQAAIIARKRFGIAPRESVEKSPYSMLKIALRRDDASAAKEHVLDLLENGHAEQQIIASFDPRQHMGSNLNEIRARSKMRPYEQEVFQRARETESEAQRKVLSLIRSIPQSERDAAFRKGQQAKAEAFN